MKHRPILFSTAMVQAILDGRKTQTRRVVKPQPDAGCPPQKVRMYSEFEPHWGKYCIIDQHGESHLRQCPYGQPGDVLWVRETWCKTPDFEYTYKASSGSESEEIRREYLECGQDWAKWKPSIHMPREAARLFLRIKAVRVERLTEISEDDAEAEGIECVNEYSDTAALYCCTICNGTDFLAATVFECLWVSINGPESWEVNPWVWVVEFERISKEEAGL